ncbi:hypothetical protein O3P69_015137 [Scylla paramamosain]|uniref:Uncharacterized protein n=1 Tax=Scylla paramamosain TaxID=85552 RepID=A0AAW0T522_SCYPA
MKERSTPSSVRAWWWTREDGSVRIAFVYSVIDFGALHTSYSAVSCGEVEGWKMWQVGRLTTLDAGCDG